jgi:mannose/fructose/N-acetylgalactosamine-specific phosphotransferase system component IIC
MTFIFGVITTFFDTVMAGAIQNGRFFYIYGVFYARGIVYYLIHIVSNFLIVLLTYKPLKNVMKKALERITQ